MAIAFPTDETVFAFFGAGTGGKVHYFDCSLVSGVHQWIHVLSQRKNSLGLRLNSAKYCSEVVTRLRLLSGVSKRGTHLADSFFIPKISCCICLERSFEMRTISAISCTFNRRFTKTRSRIFVALSSEAALFGAAGRGASKTDVPARWNSLN